jgi:HAD superfamily hydrolase (TIGR01549 family)
LAIRTVVFDVGETLVDETRHWGEWADWLGVTRFALFAAMGSVIERREHHRRVFEIVAPGVDIAVEAEKRRAAGWRYRFEPGDFYPDALPCLLTLRAAGYRIGLAGNQPEEAETALAQANVTADFIASSARWGVEKPSPAFFDKVVQAAGVAVHEIAYVGDRLDNDVLPAADAGMTAVFIRRGPWGYIQAAWPEAARAHHRIDSLSELQHRLTA